MQSGSYVRFPLQQETAYESKLCSLYLFLFSNSVRIFLQIQKMIWSYLVSKQASNLFDILLQPPYVCCNHDAPRVR